jgi:hypothetical protein
LISGLRSETWGILNFCLNSGIDHLNDEDLSFHPKKHKSLLGDPALGTPAIETWAHSIFSLNPGLKIETWGTLNFLSGCAGFPRYRIFVRNVQSSSNHTGWLSTGVFRLPGSYAQWPPTFYNAARDPIPTQLCCGT